MKKLYVVKPPASIFDELMSHGEFYVPATLEGLKTAAFLEDATRQDRIRLFKQAAHDETNDLSEAYVTLKSELDDVELDEPPEDSNFVYARGSMIENEPGETTEKIDELDEKGQ